MRVQRRRLVRLACALSLAVAAFTASLYRDTPAKAQMQGGDFAMGQNSVVVGWIHVSGDRTVEWWAYIDGLYQWGDPTSVGSNKWHADAEYIGSVSWTSYTAWKADILARSAAQGHTIVFHQHAVTEESVDD